MQKGILRKHRESQLSEYGRQLKEKQELKKQYNLRERQFKSYVVETLAKGKSGGNALERFMQRLETRLDNVVFRMGIAQTRSEARQMVSHGHFLLNGRPINIRSVQVKMNDVISLNPKSAERTLFQNAKLALKKYQAPSWLELDAEKLEAKVIGEPNLEEIAPTVEIPLIFEFYSR